VTTKENSSRLVSPVDGFFQASKNVWMTTTALPTGQQELNEAMSRLMKGIRDPEAGKKAREDMDRMREETRSRIGTVDVAVDLVRDARNQ
jgi:hypothetical protein